VRVSPLAHPGRGAGGEGHLPSPILGEGLRVRVSPLSRSGRGAEGEGHLPSPISLTLDLSLRERESFSPLPSWERGWG